MKVVAIQGSASCQTMIWLRQSYRLRAKVFHHRLGWKVTVSRDEETDIFDQLSPDYLLAVDARDHVVGTVRFLPTHGSTMLSTVFSYLLTNSPSLPAGLVEASRFCVDTERCRNQEFINLATRSLFAGMVDWALQRHYPQIAAVVDLRMERVLRRAGWSLARISIPHSMGRVTGVAGYLPVSQEVLFALRPSNYVFSDRSGDAFVHNC
ncbi:acyl-homoserine-lactone synthase [Ensifer canadensis]|uniref:acyl-homoserine-lactone synthase n=1 Tax=Ensifer canadensis TaxID=555315 RepID=UPI0035E3C27E